MNKFLTWLFDTLFRPNIEKEEPIARCSFWNCEINSAEDKREYLGKIYCPECYEIVSCPPPPPGQEGNVAVLLGNGK